MRGYLSPPNALHLLLPARRSIRLDAHGQFPLPQSRLVHFSGALLSGVLAQLHYPPRPDSPARATGRYQIEQLLPHLAGALP